MLLFGALFGVGVVPAAAVEWHTVPIRDGNSVSGVFAAHGLGQGTLMELLASPAIAKRLQRVRAGDTLELQMHDGRMLELRVFDAGARAIVVSRDSDNSWVQRRCTSAGCGAASFRIRQREAELQLASSLILPRSVTAQEASPGAEALATRPTVEAPARPIEVAAKPLARKVIPLSDIAATALALGSTKSNARNNLDMLVSQSTPQWRTPTLAGAVRDAEERMHQRLVALRLVKRGKPGGGAPSEIALRLRQKANSAVGARREPIGAQTPQNATMAQALRESPRSPVVAVTRPVATKLVAMVTEETMPEARSVAEPAAPSAQDSLLAAARQLLASKPNVETALKARRAAIAKAPEKAAESCGSIEGTWQASYPSYSCDAVVSFAGKTSSVFAMNQVGCGGIEGDIRQEGRRLRGNWRHPMCKGSLTVTLDASCNSGTGQWGVTPGQTFCEGTHPVT
ncbi:MAG: hypothetical protein HOI95_05915, partial [Chromatiales bacterium]|nr:hypothetical protein [Chromatiales bacterium]